MHVVVDSPTLEEVPPRFGLHAIIIPCVQLTDRCFDRIDAFRRAGQAARILAYSVCRLGCRPCRAHDSRLDAHLPPDCTADRLIQTLEEIARRAAPECIVTPGTSPQHVVPSKRELEVLQLMSHGLTNNEIAGILFISEATVKAHLARLFHKLGAHCRVTALVNAAHEGYIRL